MIILEKFFGYGLNYNFIGFWVIFFIPSGAIVLKISGEGPANKMPYGLSYSFDLFFPIIRLREYHYDHTKIDIKGWAKYYFYIHKLMGYLLVSIPIAGLSGLFK